MGASSKEMWRTYSSDTRVGERKLGGPILHCVHKGVVWQFIGQFVTPWLHCSQENQMLFGKGVLDYHLVSDI